MLLRAIDRIRGVVVVVSSVVMLGACASRPDGVLAPVVTTTVPGASLVDIGVATTRVRSDKPEIMFSGERSPTLDYANIIVSIPPDATRQVGKIQWPKHVPGNPATEFVTVKAEEMTRAAAKSWLNQRMRKTPKRQVLVFVHGFNTRFGDSVFRIAQIVHDSGADVAPLLFTWPSRGNILSYGYDRESTTYSRDALELFLRELVDDPNVGEISILAHSMGNWVTLEALRQMAIRHGRIPAKIDNVMLAAPDVDVDVFSSQMWGLGPDRPDFTLFVSRDDRALAASRQLWGNVERLGQIDPSEEPYASQLAAEKIMVIDLTRLRSRDFLNHGKFAASPEVVQAIGMRLAAGQTISDARNSLGDRIIEASTNVTATLGTAAGIAISAPVAIVDPNTRDTLDENIDAFGDQIADSLDDAFGSDTQAPQKPSAKAGADGVAERESPEGEGGAPRDKAPESDRDAADGKASDAATSRGTEPTKRGETTAGAEN